MKKFFLLHCVHFLCCLNIALAMSDKTALLNMEIVPVFTSTKPSTLVWYPVASLSSMGEANDAAQERVMNSATEVNRQLGDEVELAQPWHALIVKIANEYQVDHRLIKAVVYHESRFNMDAISKKGAIGLMQVMPNTAQRFGFSDLHNPEINLRAGTAYLKWLLAYFGNNVRLTVAAYNAGEGAVKRYGGVPPYQETQRYVANILRYYQREAHSFSNNEKQKVASLPPLDAFVTAVRALGYAADLWLMPSKK